MVAGEVIKRGYNQTLGQVAGGAGRVIGMRTFGASAPLKELQRKFGFEPERVVAAAMEVLGRD